MLCVIMLMLSGESKTRYDLMTMNTGCHGESTLAPVKRTWGMSRQITATHVQHLDVCAPPPAVNSQPRSLMAFARRLWVGGCEGVGRARCLWKIYRITHVRRRNKHKHGVHVHALCTNADKLFGRIAFGEDCVLPNLHRVPIGSVILLLALETHKVTPVIEIALSWAKSISETRSPPHPNALHRTSSNKTISISSSDICHKQTRRRKHAARHAAERSGGNVGDVDRSASAAVSVFVGVSVVANVHRKLISVQRPNAQSQHRTLFSEPALRFWPDHGSPNTLSQPH